MNLKKKPKSRHRMHPTSENKLQTRDKEERGKVNPLANLLQIPLEEVEWDKLVVTTASLLLDDSNFEPQIY